MKSDIIQEILDRITPEQHKEYEREFQDMLAHNRWMEENDLEYNTPTSPSLQILKEYGFYPIGITSYFLEETFIYNTAKEANLAYKKLEKELGLICGWWYSKRQFEKELKENTKQGGYYEDGYPTIYWL